MDMGIDASRRDCTVSRVAKVISVGVQDFRYHLAAFVRRAEAGERIAVTFHNKIVAALLSPSDLEKVAGKVDLPRRAKPARR